MTVAVRWSEGAGFGKEPTMRYLLISAISFLVLGLVSVSSGGVEPTASAGRAAILVLPFSTPPGSTEAWMGSAIQRDLETDLMEGTQASVMAPSTAAPAADSAQALETARQLGATFVIFGQVQMSSAEVRLTGQVLNVADAKPVGPLKATGSSSDLFHLEDAIAGQTLGLLPRSLLSAQAANALSRPAARAQPAPPGQNTLPRVLTPQQDSTSYYTAPDTYAGAPQQPYYSYAPSPDFYPAESGPAYVEPVPAYTYGYPYCDLFPFFGFSVDIGRGFDRFPGFDHDRGHFDGGGHFHGEGMHGGRPLAGNGAIGHLGGAFNHNRGLSMGAAPRLNSSGFARPGGFRAAPRISGFSGGGFHGGRSFGGFHGGSIGGGFHGGGASHAGGGGRR